MIVASIVVPAAALYITFGLFLACGLGGMSDTPSIPGPDCTAANEPLWYLKVLTLGSLAVLPLGVVVALARRAVRWWNLALLVSFLCLAAAEGCLAVLA